MFGLDPNIHGGRKFRRSLTQRAAPFASAQWTLGSSPTAFTHLLSRLAFEITV